MSSPLQLEFRTLARLSLPIIVGQITQMLFGLIDTLMIGHLGTTELAAVAFGNSIFILFLVFFGGDRQRDRAPGRPCHRSR